MNPIDKAWKVINSCKTVEQARSALRWLELFAEQYPDTDVGPLKRELMMLFGLDNERV